MRVTEVSQNSKLVGQKCQHCPRQVLPGQVVLTCHLPLMPAGHRSFVVHRQCMESLMDSGPQDNDQYARQFANLRERMIETGSAFPDRVAVRDGS